jgi:hypothetical protein
MIISTSKSDMMLKRSLGKDKTVVIAIGKMLDQFALDPTVMNPPRQAYIVTNEDISAKNLKDKFEQALLTKHPATKVIFINKSSKPIYQNGLQGLDAILQKPKTQDIVQTISAVIAQTTVTDAVERQVQEPLTIPDYVPPETYSEPQPEQYEEQPEQNSEPEELPVPSIEPEPEPEPVVEEKKSGLVDRIEHTNSVGDASIVMREMTATSIIKDLYETNSTYAGIEEKLKSLNESIFLIMGDSQIKSLDVKLSKIRALLHDKAFFRAKGDTLIEQRLEEVVETICEQTSSLLQSRLDEINAAIRRSYTEKDFDVNSARLSGINEERANLITELGTLEVNINEIYKATDQLIVTTATDIAKESNDPTGNDFINAKLKAEGGMVLSESTIDAIRGAMELGTTKAPETFKKLKLAVVSTMQTLSKMLEVDNEIIAAQQQMIAYLKSNNIEETVDSANSLLKKAVRVYVGEEGVGRTIIPYLISKYKSRQNANVLLLDLTGTAKYTQYKILYTNVDQFLIDNTQREFMLVSGKVDNTVEVAQKIVTALYKAADYYRYINVVIDPEQQMLFQTIAQDVLSVNFIVDTSVPRIERMRNTIDSCTVPNVARRVIINRCDTPIRTIIKKLGLDDQMDYQVCTVPSVPAIIDAGLNGYDPYGISKVDLTMEEVIRHA